MMIKYFGKIIEKINIIFFWVTIWYQRACNKRIYIFLYDLVSLKFYINCVTVRLENEFWGIFCNSLHKKGASDTKIIASGANRRGLLDIWKARVKTFSSKVKQNLAK